MPQRRLSGAEMWRQESLAVYIPPIESSLPPQHRVFTQRYRAAIIEMKEQAELLLTPGKHEPAELTGPLTQQSP